MKKKKWTKSIPFVERGISFPDRAKEPEPETTFDPLFGAHGLSPDEEKALLSFVRRAERRGDRKLSQEEVEQGIKEDNIHDFLEEMGAAIYEGIARLSDRMFGEAFSSPAVRNPLAALMQMEAVLAEKLIVKAFTETPYLCDLLWGYTIVYRTRDDSKYEFLEGDLFHRVFAFAPGDPTPSPDSPNIVVLSVGDGLRRLSAPST